MINGTRNGLVLNIGLMMRNWTVGNLSHWLHCRGVARSHSHSWKSGV